MIGNIAEYEEWLNEEEKSAATKDKYIRDVKKFYEWAGEREINKTLTMEYKDKLAEEYKPSSVNSIITSLNVYFSYNNRYDLKLKSLKIQRQIFLSEEKELTKSEYERLLATALSNKNERLYLLMQTICSTGIRVSELKYITVESIAKEYADVNNKGKRRRIYIPHELCVILRKYCKKEKRTKGSIFVTKNGNPLDRSNIWGDMKNLCKQARVSEKKVFPHNLRHLFARTYYSKQKDISRLADILGHSNINTTRIYTMETGEIHRKQIQELGLVGHIRFTT